MKKILLLTIAAWLFFTALLAPAGTAAGGEDITLTCMFRAQVVNIETWRNWDQYGNPEVAGWVHFGYWRLNKKVRWEGIATHYVYATEEWLPDLRAAYFDQRRPNINVNSEIYDSYDDCSSRYKGVVSYIQLNPDFKTPDNSGGGSSGGGGGEGKGKK